MAEVSSLCKRTVVSTKPVQAGRIYTLSVLDRTMEHNNLRIIYYYRFRCGYETGEITKKLRESLSEMLTIFPIVTGRLMKTSEGHWVVKCNDAGVRMIEAKAKGSVDEFLQKANREEEHKLTYWEHMLPNPYFWSTFYIQLTEFEKGGLAIGLSCSHLLADAASATMLIKAWADTTLLGKMLSPPYIHPLPLRELCHKSADQKRNSSLIDHYKTAMEKDIYLSSMIMEKFGTVTLEFEDDMVRQCITDSQDGTSVSNGSILTPFEALAGLLWVGVSRAKGRKDRLLDMSICLEMRKVLGLDKGLFGNAMIFHKVSAGGVKEGGIVEAARTIAEVVGKMGNERVIDLIEWLESDTGVREKLSQQPPILNGPELICANWESLSSYNATFEKGVEPIRVSCYLESIFGEGQILILPSPGVGVPLRRMAMVTLPAHQIVRLCSDAIILRYSPTILMGGNKAHV